MHKNLLNAGFAFVDHWSGKIENVQVGRVIKPLTKVLHKSFCCTYACYELYLRVKDPEALVRGYLEIP